MNTITARALKSVEFVLVASALVAGLFAAEPSDTDTEVIRIGAARSSVIISGQITGSRGGGGGATGIVKVDEVLKAPPGFQTPKTVAVYYLSAKQVPYTNTYLFFLRPATTNAQTGYNDVTDKGHPFVRATETNMFFLRSRLQDEK